MKRALLAAIMMLVLISSTSSAFSTPVPGVVTAEFERAQQVLIADNIKIGAANVAWVGELSQLQDLEKVVAATVADLASVTVYECFSDWWGIAYGSYVYLDGLMNKVIAEGGTPSSDDNALAQGYAYMVGLLPAAEAVVDCTLQDGAT